MNKYEQMRHELDSKMLRSSQLSGQEQKNFVDQEFKAIYNAREEKKISQEYYVKLVNRLAAYKQGRYNDYVDMLAGAAVFGYLDDVISGKFPFSSSEDARARSQTITKLFGIPPAKPDFKDKE